MLIFLYGKDTYRLQQKLKDIEGRYKKIHQSGLNLEKIAAEQIDFQEFWDKLQQTSMFTKKKLFFLENLFSNQKFKEEFRKKIQLIAKSQDIVVVFEKKDLPQNDKVYLTLKKYGESQEFKPLKGKKLEDWVVKEIQKYGAKIEKNTLEKLIDFVGNDCWRLSNEIKKLALLKGTTIVDDLSKKIEMKDVEISVKPKIEVDIFETIDALAKREKKKALRLIQNHLEKGDSPLYLLKMINFQFRNLLLVKARSQSTNDIRMIRIDNLSRELGMHPYVVKKTINLLRNFSLEELKKIYQKIFEADLNIKTGRIQPEEGLKILIAQI